MSKFNAETIPSTSTTQNRYLSHSDPSVPLSDHSTNTPKAIDFSARLRRTILHFTPSWFSVNMGTGITSILLHNLPYNNIYLQRISVCIFVLNIGSHPHISCSASDFDWFPFTFSPVLHILGHFNHSIRPLPRSVELDDTESGTISFPWDIPYGACNNY